MDASRLFLFLISFLLARESSALVRTESNGCYDLAAFTVGWFKGRTKLFVI